MTQLTTTTIYNILLTSILFTTVSSIPLNFSITSKQKECLFTSVNKNEYITTSLFITSGSDLKARMMIQGPILQPQVSSAAEVLAAGLRFDKNSGSTNNKQLKLNIDTDVDFEHLYDGVEEELDDDFAAGYYDDDENEMDDIDDALLEEYYYIDDDDEYIYMEDDAMDETEKEEIRKAKAERDKMSGEEKAAAKEKRHEEKAMKMEEMRKKKEKQQEKRKEMMKEKDRRKAMMKEKHQMHMDKLKGLQQLRRGEPLQKTFRVTEEGWYRFCVAPLSDLIEVEMELRKSSEVGNPNQKTGHLQTYEHHDMAQREKKLMLHMDAKKLAENGIKEKDLEMTKNQITKLNKLLYDIQEKQKNERHRLSVHKVVNEHSHSRMVLNSLFETTFYIAISCFQVYTIRKWFSGSPILSY